MKPYEADRILEEIATLAETIESDTELMKIDSRYHVCAKWIETDVECCDPL